MLRNLKAEMARQNISQETISKSIGINKRTLYNKISCKSEFTRNEMIKIRDLFFPDLTLDYLFNNQSVS